MVSGTVALTAVFPDRASYGRRRVPSANSGSSRSHALRGLASVKLIRPDNLLPNVTTTRSRIVGRSVHRDTLVIFRHDFDVAGNSVNGDNAFCARLGDFA